MGLGFIFGLGYNGGQVQTVHATMEDLAGSELQIKTLWLKSGQSDCTVTFAGGRYLHLNPDTNITVVDNTEAGADMEYYNGVLKFYINNNDDFNGYRNYKISVYALNSTDKQLTVAVDYYIDFNTFDYPKGDLTVTTLDSVKHSVRFSDEFYTTGTVTVNGYAELNVNPNGLNNNYTSTFEAGALRVLDNASFDSHTYSNDDSYAIKVTNLTINTNGDFSVYAYNDGHISALKVDAGTITLTKCHLLEIYSKTQSSDRTKVTNVTSLRNAPETPIDGFYATYVDDYADGLHLDVVPTSALHTVSFNSNGGSGEMAAVENVYYSYKIPACTFTAPEGKKFSYWSIGAPDGPTKNSGSTIEITQDITLYAHWKNTVPSNSELSIRNSFGSAPSSSSYDDVNGVLTLSSSTNCDISVYSPSGRSDLTIVFDGNYLYGSPVSHESNYFAIMNDYGDITLTSETPVTVYACITTRYSLTIKGNVHLVPTGLPTTNYGSYWGYLKVNGYFEGLIHASNKLSVLENASISAIDRYLLDSSQFRNAPVISAKYFEFDTTGEVEIGTKTQVYGTWQNAAIGFYDTTSAGSSAHSEIIDRMTIKRCGQDGCLKLYRYNDYDYNFVGIRPKGSGELGFPYAGELHFNSNISAYTEGGVDAELLTLKPCIVTFNNGGGSGTMATDYIYIDIYYTLPACTFTAPAGKHFEGWSINGSDPVNANTTYAVHIGTESLTLTAVWASDGPEEFMVVYVTNGAEGSNDMDYAEDGSQITLATPESLNFIPQEHYHFVGWAVGALNATPLKNPGEKVTITAETYIYAIWEEDATYTVEYHANGSESVDHLDGGIYAGTYALKTVQQVGFVAPNGKQFKGWSFTSNGEIINTPTITIDGNKELYAIWEDIPAEQYTISFNNNGGSGEIANVQYGGTYTLPTTCSFTAPEGKEFAGWALSENGEKITTATIQITENTQLFALWKDIEAEPDPEPDPEPEVEPKPEPAKAGLPAGAVVAIVIASVLVAGVGGFAVVWFVVKKKTCRSKKRYL